MQDSSQEPTSEKKSPGRARAVAPKHISRFSDLDEILTTVDGLNIKVLQLNTVMTEGLIGDWATHFRRHYCPDDDIDRLRSGTGLTRSEYLKNLVFPDKHEAPGPGIRAGDFAEILVCDYLEYVLGYWVPRQKYAEKASRNESVKGVDVVGFKADPATMPTIHDELITFEVKAKLTGRKYKGQLQAAIDDSSKDYLRQAMTLNAMKRRLLKVSESDSVAIVERFQNISDRPYQRRCGAAGVLADDVYNASAVSTSDASNHADPNSLVLLVFRGADLMSLVNRLYQEAADEA